MRKRAQENKMRSHWKPLYAFCLAGIAILFLYAAYTTDRRSLNETGFVLLWCCNALWAAVEFWVFFQRRATLATQFSSFTIAATIALTYAFDAASATQIRLPEFYLVRPAFLALVAMGLISGWLLGYPRRRTAPHLRLILLQVVILVANVGYIGLQIRGSSYVVPLSQFQNKKTGNAYCPYLTVAAVEFRSTVPWLRSIFAEYATENDHEPISLPAGTSSFRHSFAHIRSSATFAVPFTYLPGEVQKPEIYLVVKCPLFRISTGCIVLCSPCYYASGF